MAKQVLESYLPRFVTMRLASCVPICTPEARITSAAVLLSDIQGFSSLIATFSAAGPAGIEEITWVLSEYFADFVEVIYSYRGDVLCIAGDAFLCFWPAANDQELAEATQRAAQAALAIQERLHGREAGRGHRFATRLGLGAGPLAIAFAGGIGGRWELVADGPPLRAAGAQERSCEPGCVRLAPECGALLSPHGHLRPVSNPPGYVLESLGPHLLLPQAPAPPPRILPDQPLRPFLAPSVLQRLDTETAWLAEQRYVSVLMADLPTLGDLSSEGLERTHRYLQIFQAAVYRFEGSVRVDIDSKGALVLAVFGLPPIAHEDDAVRALDAAELLQRDLLSAGLRCGLGIATGRAFCGSFGSDLRREYMLRGEVINRAARIMQVAVDGVLCDQATQQASRGRVVFEPHAKTPTSPRSPFDSSRAEASFPGPLFRPLGRSAQLDPSQTPLVGRQREQAQLDALLDALSAGEDAGVVILEAEAGVGKSRLLQEMAQRARSRGIQVLASGTEAVEVGIAYNIWRRIFRDLLGWSESSNLEQLWRHWQGTAINERLLPLLSAVLPIQLNDNDLTSEMKGGVRAANTQRLLTQFLHRQAAEKPLLLLLEDVQWLDTNSWALLMAIVREVAPLALVMTSRPPQENASPDYALLQDHQRVRKIRLDVLGVSETEALACQLIGVDVLPPEFLNRLLQVVAGNPFFCEEMVQTMLETGVISVEGGECRLRDLDSFVFPASVESVIISRLDRLSPTQLLCLKVASVVGHDFRQSIVQDTHPISEERPLVPRHLLSLQGMNFTVCQQQSEETGPEYSFRHAITRDVTYELMTLAQKQEMHAAVATYFETSFADSLASHYSILAYHWGQALDVVRMVSYLELAGQQALTNGAFVEALLYFTTAVEQSADSRVEADALRQALWQKGIATAHYFLGELQKARIHLEQAICLLDRPLPRRTTGVAIAIMRLCFRQLLHRLFPRFFIGRRSGEGHLIAQLTDCYRRLGQIYYLDGDSMLLLVYMNLRGLNIGELGGPSDPLARILSNMGILCGFNGALRWSDWYAGAAVAMAETGGQFSAAAYVWSVNSVTFAQRGSWQLAKAANAEALRRVQELGDFNQEAEAWVIRSTIALCEGHFNEAPHAWQNARTLAVQRGNDQILCWSLLDEVDTCLGWDDDESAARVLDQALAVPTAASDGSSRIDKCRATAMVRFRQGRYAESVAAADEVMEMIFRQTPSGYHWVDFFASAVEVYLLILAEDSPYSRQHRRRLLLQARRGCRQLLRLSRIFGNVVPRSRLLLSRLALCQGQRRLTRRMAQRALVLATSRGMPYEQALALLELGALEPEGLEGRQKLRQALAIFQSLGATACVRRTRALLSD